MTVPTVILCAVIAGVLVGRVLPAGAFSDGRTSDVWDVSKLHGATHVSGPERDALGSILAWGAEDVFRRLYDQERLYSWWDYRAGDFHKGRGMRIDLVLASRPLADTVRYALIDRNARKGKLPSDHAPLLVDFDD